MHRWQPRCQLRKIRQIELLELAHHPGGLVVMVAVAVGAVVHNLAIVQLACAAQLPEDNPTVATHAQLVSLGCMLHLLLGEIAHIYHCPAESTGG